MKRPLIYSAILHITVLILLLVGFYNPFPKTIPSEQPMMIEFVQVAEQSAAPQLAPEVIQDKAPAPTPPKPVPPVPTPPEPPKPEPAPQPQPEPEPVKPLPQPEPEPEIKPEDAEPIPDPKAKPKPKEKPKEEKPKPQKAEITLDKKKKEKTKTDDQNKDKKKKPSSAKTDDQNKDKKKKSSKSFDDLLNESEPTDDDGAPSQGKGAPATSIGPVLTASETDALSRHMSKCWIIPSGLRDAKNIRVPIKLNVARDGTVQKAEIMDKARMNKDSAYRTAAESARRAVLDPQCSPLPIPPEKYDMFKEFIFNFDPKEMF